MTGPSNTASYSAANFLLEALHEVGVEYIFANMGTDHAPVIEALAGLSPESALAGAVSLACPTTIEIVPSGAISIR